MQNSRKICRTLRVALLVDEFFGGWETAIGGYGALARNYFCRYIPNKQIRVDVLLNCWGGDTICQQIVDQTVLYKLPADAERRRDWLHHAGYDLFVSIEMTAPSFDIIQSAHSSIPLLYWVQDPRDLTLYQPRLATVKRLRDHDWSYISGVETWVGEALKMGRVKFCSQGPSLSQIARSMYGISPEVTIDDLPNPVEFNIHFNIDRVCKTQTVIFLGRLEAQKRAWIFCAIAMAMPNYEFLVLGATGQGRNETGNSASLSEYRNPDGSSKIPNLKFLGHLDGEPKRRCLEQAKLIVNTSIWEGIPVSWLEALAYGTLIVAAFDRDNIVSRFGTFVGEVLGDGLDSESIKLYCRAIEYWMIHEDERRRVARAGIEYIRSRHSIERFTTAMRRQIARCVSQDEESPTAELLKELKEVNPSLAPDRMPAKHPHWTGFLLLDVANSEVTHEGPGNRGSFQWQGRSLLVSWRDYPPEEFIEVNRLLIHSSYMPDFQVGLTGNHYATSAVALRSFSASPHARREAASKFDTSLDEHIAPMHHRPLINCFYEVLSDDGSHQGLLSCLATMRATGHPVRVWSYDPDRLRFLRHLGVEFGIAQEILPRHVFELACKKAEVRYFSDLFRYALLYQVGGLWMDTDIVLIRPFSFVGEYFFNLQWTGDEHLICGNVLVAPPLSPHFGRLFEASLDRLISDGDRNFGDVGPKLLSEYVFSDRGRDLWKWVFSPMCFNSIDWSESNQFALPIHDLEEYLSYARVFGVHLWNKITNSGIGSGVMRALKADTDASAIDVLSGSKPFSVPNTLTVTHSREYECGLRSLLMPVRLTAKEMLVIEGDGKSRREADTIAQVLNSLQGFLQFCRVTTVDERWRLSQGAVISNFDIIVDLASDGFPQQRDRMVKAFRSLVPGGSYLIEGRRELADLLVVQPSALLTTFMRLRDGSAHHSDDEGLAEIEDQIAHVVILGVPDGLSSILVAVQRRF